jgi:hypothetical protein
MTGLVDAKADDFSLTLSQVAEHLYFNMPTKKGFEEHQEHAKQVMEYLLDRGLVEITGSGGFRAKLRIEGHSLPELIHRASRDIKLI